MLTFWPGLICYFGSNTFQHVNFATEVRGDDNLVTIEPVLLIHVHRQKSMFILTAYNDKAFAYVTGAVCLLGIPFYPSVHFSGLFEEAASNPTIT